MRTRTRSMYAAGLLAIVLAVGACATPATTAPPQSDAEKAACAAIQTWSDEMRAFAELDPTTATSEDVDAQAEAVSASWAAVMESLRAVESADEAALETAAEGLEAALAEFPTDVPVADAIDSVKTAAEPLREAYQEMANGLGCAIATPY